MAEAYNDHLKTTPGDPCTALLESGFNAVYDADCYHLAEHVYTRGNWANDFDRLFRSEPQYLTHGVRYVENHDEKRVCSPIAWGGTGRTILPAIMTLVYASGKGPVLVYNGQEVGERAEAPGGFGGHNGRTSIFDYTCLPQLQPWVAGGRFDASLLDEDSAELRDFHARLLPLLQHPALDRGDFYGLNWANMKTPPSAGNRRKTLPDTGCMPCSGTMPMPIPRCWWWEIFLRPSISITSASPFPSMRSTGAASRRRKCAPET